MDNPAFREMELLFKNQTKNAQLVSPLVGSATSDLSNDPVVFMEIYG